MSRKQFGTNGVGLREKRKTIIILTLGKRNEDLSTGKRNISRAFRNVISFLLLLITLKELVTTSNWTISTFRLSAKLTTKVRRRCYSRVAASTECQCQKYFIRKAFLLCHFAERVLNFYCICFLSRFQTLIDTLKMHVS